MLQKAGRYYGRTIIMERGVTQVRTVFPTFFNIVVDAEVRAVLLEVCGTQEA